MSKLLKNFRFYVSQEILAELAGRHENYDNEFDYDEFVETGLSEDLKPNQYTLMYMAGSRNIIFMKNYSVEDILDVLDDPSRTDEQIENYILEYGDLPLGE